MAHVVIPKIKVKKIPEAEMKPLYRSIIAQVISFYFDHPENMEEFKKWEREWDAQKRAEKCAATEEKCET